MPFLQVWTLGEKDVPDDFEDVRMEVSNKLFSAPTQFDEPRALNDLSELADAEAVLAAFDPDFLAAQQQRLASARGGKGDGRGGGAASASEGGGDDGDGGEWLVVAKADAFPKSDVHIKAFNTLEIAKAFCVDKGCGGFVVYKGKAYFRPQRPEQLVQASVAQAGRWPDSTLYVRPASSSSTTTTSSSSSSSSSPSAGGSGSAPANASGKPRRALRSYASAVSGRASKVLRARWAEFMLVDLNGFKQRSRLAAIIFRTFKAADRAASEERGRDEGGLRDRPAALAAVATFLGLVKDLVCMNFFAPTYNVFPRCATVVGGKELEAFFYRKTKAMRSVSLLGPDAAVAGVDGSVAPVLRFAFGGGGGACPILAAGGSALVPPAFRKEVDENHPPAVPHGFEVRAVVAHSNRVLAHDEAWPNPAECIFVLVPAAEGDGDGDGFEGGGGLSGPMDAVESVRVHLKRLQASLDPRKDASPGDSGGSWQALAEDPALAEEHFGRAYGCLQKNATDGVLQKAKLAIHQAILDIWNLSISTNQNLRLNSLWNVFQRCYKSKIEDVCFLPTAAEDANDDGGNDSDDGGDDGGDGGENEAKDDDSGGGGDLVSTPIGALRPTLSSDGSVMSDFVNPSFAHAQEVAKGSAVEMTASKKAPPPRKKDAREAVIGNDDDDDALSSDASRYLEHRDISDRAWLDFRKECRREFVELLKVLEETGHDRLLGDFMASPKNINRQKKRGLAFLDLVLYEDETITGTAVRVLHRHFNRRVELTSRFIRSTLVLEEEDKDTLKFVSKRRLKLQRHLQLFAHPYVGGAASGKDPVRRAKATRKRLKNLQDLVSVLFHDPFQSPGLVGLTNLTWTPLYKVPSATTGDDGGDATSDSDAEGGGGGAKSLEERIRVLDEYGTHPLIRGLPKRHEMEEMNQQMLAEQAVHTPVLEFLGQLLSTVRSQEDFDKALSSEQVEVVKACVVFLFYFVFDHNDNSMLLTNPTDLGRILKLLQFWRGTEVILLLREILVDNDPCNMLLEEANVAMFVNMLFSTVKEAMAVDDRSADDVSAKMAAAMLASSNAGLKASSAPRGQGGGGQGADWSRASALTDLLAAVIESDKGPITARQELVAQLMEKQLVITSAELSEEATAALRSASRRKDAAAAAAEDGGDGGSSGGGRGDVSADALLVAAFLFVDPARVRAAAAAYAPVGASGGAHGGSIRESYVGDSVDAGGGDFGGDAVPRLYDVMRVEREYERHTLKSRPPRKFDTVHAWKKYHLKCRALPAETHLAFHLKFVDILGMLAKGDNMMVEQWCACFIPEASMMQGLASKHVALKGVFLRYMHGIYFSRSLATNSALTGGGDAAAQADEMGDDDSDMFFHRNKEALLARFGELNRYLRLLLQLQKEDFDSELLCEEEKDFENVVVDVVLPFLKDFFSGDWPLVDTGGGVGGQGDQLRSSMADSVQTAMHVNAAVAKGGGGGGLVLPSPRERSSSKDSDKDSSHSSSVDRHGPGTPRTPRGGGGGGGGGGAEEEDAGPSLLRTCARHPRKSSIAHNLARLGRVDKILRWENAREGVYEALDAALRRTVGEHEDARFGDELMVDPESDLCVRIHASRQRIEATVLQMEREGVMGDEDEDVIQTRRKKAAVKGAMPHFVHCLLETLDSVGDRTVKQAAPGLLSSKGNPKNLVAVKVDKLLDPVADPFFEVFTDALRNHIMLYIRAHAHEAVHAVGLGGGSDGGDAGGNGGAAAGRTPSSGLGRGAEGLWSRSTLGAQLAALTGGLSVGDALEASGFDFERIDAAAERDVAREAEEAARARGGGGIGLRRLASFTDRAKPTGQSLEQQLVIQEAAWRGQAFDTFTGQSRRYMEALLSHLCGYLSNDYTACDIYLAEAMQHLMASQREALEAAFALSPTAAQSELSRRIQDADLVQKLVQCAFINLGGPEAVMALVSLGYTVGGNELNPYYAALVPQANELGNALMEGGNYEVQRRFFEVFIAKKMSFESHKEEGFLRSLQMQLRAFRRVFVNPNMDLKNAGQLASMERAKVQASELLKFIQNLVEGHQTAHQEFMLVQPSVTETVNIVKEVASFYLALFENIEGEFKLLDDKDFNSKYAPPVAGYANLSPGTRAAHEPLNASAGVGGAATTAAAFGRTRIVAWHRMVGYAKLRIVLPVLVQCLRTMQEFCAGPCVSNQLALVRTGICNTFPALFGFFGALQLRQDAPPLESKKVRPATMYGRTASTLSFRSAKAEAKKVEAKDSTDIKLFKKLWRSCGEDLSTSILADTSLLGSAAVGGQASLEDDAQRSYNLSFGKASAPGQRWVGNDPALLYLLFRLRMDHEKKQRGRAGGFSSGGVGGSGGGGYGDDLATQVALLGPLKLQEQDGHGSHSPARGGGGSHSPPRGGDHRNLRSSVGDNLRGSIGGNLRSLAVHSDDERREARSDFDDSNREGGWVRDKQEFVKANIEEKWRPQQGSKHGEWRFKRELRKPSRNVYSDIEVLTADCFELEAALVVFIQSLIEGGDVVPEVVDNVKQNWDMGIMYGNAANWLGVMQEVEATARGLSPMNAARNRVSEVTTMAVQYHILVESMSDTGVMGPAFKADFHALCKLRGLHHTTGAARIPRVGRVEVLGKDDQCTVLYFPVPTIVAKCWSRPEVQHQRDLILYPDDVSKRGNPDEKIKNFLEEGEVLIDILEHEFMLMQLAGQRGVWPVLAELGRRSDLLGKVTLALSILINVVLLATFRYNDKGNKIIGYTLIQYTTLPQLHFVAACLLLVSYAVASAWRHVVVQLQDNPDGVFVVRDRFLNRVLHATCSNAVGRWLGFEAGGGGGSGAGGSASSNGSAAANRFSFSLPRPLLLFYFFVNSDWRAAYHLAFAGISFLGLFVDSLFFAVSLVDVVRMNSTMQKVIRSFTFNLDQVIVTVLFMVILLYMFAAFAFSKNLDYMFEDHTACGPDAEEEGYCGGDFKNWLLLHIDYGVINPLIFNDNDGAVSTVQATVFGFLYYFLINLVITAIVSGIIIDTFAQMRSDRNEVDSDLRASCFICDIEPEDFEQFGVRYIDHIKQDHNMWQYIWLKIYLRDKDRTLYSGTEMHVAPFLEKNSPRCMPIKKSRAIQGKVKDKATLPTILSKINAMASATDRAIEDLRKRIEKTTEDTSNRIADLVDLQRHASAQQQAQPGQDMA